ncbi:MAG: hypothetical protein ACK5Q7_08135, partial [Cyanobacteriota bacterium]
MGLSIVTVCMNRREHLLVTAPRVAAWPHHGEHLIVDWSSAVPLRREDLPRDPRVRLMRVEGETRWSLCRGDIAELWDQRDDRYAVLCVQHEHVPNESVKFLGEVQSPYPKKNWSSLMLLNCARCTALT